MSGSRKDAHGGHRKHEIVFGNRKAGVVVWGESGKRYAKRLRSKLGRRHGRVSLRDLEVLEPSTSLWDWDDYDQHIADTWYEDWEDLQEQNYEEDYDYGYEYDPWDTYWGREPRQAQTVEVWLRNVGSDAHANWIPCAAGDPGAVMFYGEVD